jgi:phosphate transport system permease protein
VAIVPLVAIVYYVGRKGGAVVNVAFLTKEIPVLSRSVGPGMGPAIIGTLLITGVATLMAVPLGILAAVYLNEYGKKNRLATVIRTMADVMTGVPSIVMGLFIYTIWVLQFGLSGFAGSLALACLMLPIVIRSTEEILRLVPAGLREASMALGASRARTIVTVVLPAAISGITSGSLLAVARAAGETAPLLFTIGAARQVNTPVFNGANTALSTQIFRNAQLPFVGAQQRAWGAALTLIVLVVVLTILARIVTKRFSVPLR